MFFLYFSPIFYVPTLHFFFLLSSVFLFRSSSTLSIAVRHATATPSPSSYSIPSTLSRADRDSTRDSRVSSELPRTEGPEHPGGDWTYPLPQSEIYALVGECVHCTTLLLRRRHALVAGIPDRAPVSVSLRSRFRRALAKRPSDLAQSPTSPGSRLRRTFAAKARTSRRCLYLPGRAFVTCLLDKPLTSLFCRYPHAVTSAAHLGQTLSDLTAISLSPHCHPCRALNIAPYSLTNTTSIRVLLCHLYLLIIFGFYVVCVLFRNPKPEGREATCNKVIGYTGYIGL